MNCHTCESSKEDLVYESKYWIILLAKKQSYIGRCVIDLKRHCGSLSGEHLYLTDNNSIFLS